ncbi:MAG TPA: hypothetical protein PKK60_00290 [archaeon]|nr:hypothetical protein [archaeon]
MALPKFLVGISDSVKNFYYTLENKWYDLLDWLDPKIPVYKVIDPIDKVIPSFILFLLFIFFIIILLTYLIRFSSPYEFVFTVADSTSGMKLSGVILSGSINEKIFEETPTDASGETKVLTGGPKYNIYEMFGAILFGAEEKFIAQITTQKEGYENWNDKELSFESKKAEIQLNKLPDPPKPNPNQVKIELYDDSTIQKIIDDTEFAYIKYECGNKKLSGSPFLIKDGEDGAVDGTFTIIENDCKFIITEASSPGYIPLGSSKTIDSTKDKDRIYLEKLASDEGIANVFVYDLNGTSKKPLQGINVTFTKGSIIEEAITNTPGLATKTLPVGDYIITIRDANYEPITEDSNKIIKIEKGKRTEIEIRLIPSKNLGMIYLKIVDKNNTPINQAQILLVDLTNNLNGTYSATNENSNRMIYYSGTTDKNGLFKREGYHLDEKIAAVISKEDSQKIYSIETILPKIVRYNESYQIVILEEATIENSAFATITVKDINTTKPIYQASAYLYQTINVEGTVIENLKIFPNGKLTDKDGNAYFNYLKTAIYSAGADLRGDYFSGISSPLSIDKNEHKDFNVFLNLNGSIFFFKLVDYKNENELTGSIDLYYLNSENEKTLIETITTKENGYYKSKNAFRKTDKLIAVGKSTKYVQSSLPLGGDNPFNYGNNIYTIKLISNNDLDNNNTPDGNGNGGNKRVNVFFDPSKDIYPITENYLNSSSPTNVLDSNKRYTAVFRAVISGSIDYNELLSLVRIVGAGQIINTRPGIIGENRTNQNKFDCNTINQDILNSVHPDTYYFPANMCSESKYIQGGFKWANSDLEKKVYLFVIDFNIDSNSDKKSLEIHYRAKEKDNNGTTETDLYKEYFTIGEPFKNDGVYFRINYKNEYLTMLGNSTPENNGFFLLTNQTNKLKITLTNKSGEDIISGTLKAYSHLGATNQFNFTSSGEIYFNQEKNQKTITIQNGIRLQKNESKTFDLNIFPNQEGWLVFVLEEANKQTKKVFVKIDVNGKLMILDKANFLAGVENQLYDAKVIPKEGNEKLKITSVKVTVFNDYDTTQRYKANIIQNPINLSSNNSSIVEDTFSLEIPGIYRYNKDCIEVEVDAKGVLGDVYQTLIETIIAGSGGTLDTELNCIDVDFNGSLPNNEFEPVATMDWGTKKELKVTNIRCDGNVSIAIATGLICNIKGTTQECNGTILNLGESVIFDITAKNIDYDSNLPAPNFSDVLGYFPIYIKGKIIEKSKNYSIAKTAHISVINSNQCFAINKNYFDFIANNTSRLPVDLVNRCKYVEIGDYYVPQAFISAFGYNLDLNKPIYDVVQFRPSATVIGRNFSVTSTNRNVTYWESYIDLNKKRFEEVDTTQVNSQATPNDFNINKVHYYKNLRFDLKRFNGKISKLKINFTDRNYDPSRNIKTGFSIDGELKIIYSDGTSTRINPQSNFNLNTATVTCNGTTDCQIKNSMADNDLDLKDKDGNYLSGTLTINLPTSTKTIDYVDMNVIGNLWRKNLDIRIKPYIETTQTENTYVLEPNETTVELQLFTNDFIIHAAQGTEYVIKHLDDIPMFKSGVFVSMGNPKLYLKSNNPNVVVWIEGNLLKAKFIGPDVSELNSTEINAEVIRDYGQGIGYGLIEITDYVQPTAGKTISGVR